MVRFLGTDGGVPSTDFGPQLPQVPGFHQADPNPLTQIVSDAEAQFMGLGGDMSMLGLDGLPGGGPLPAHGDNLAEKLPDTFLNKTGSDIVEKIKQYIDDRKPWSDKFAKGLESMGLVKSDMDDGAFPGAATVTSSLLSEAVVHHWALGFGETWPSEGPAKAKVMGEQTVEKTGAADRIAEYLNFQMTFEDDDGYNEHSRLMYLVPFHGCAFKKVFEDADLDRTVGVCVEAQDLIVPPRATSLKSAPLYAHRFTRTENEMRRLMRAGFYRDIDLGEPEASTLNDDTQKSKDDQQGVSEPSEADSFTLLEAYIDLDIPGLEDADNQGQKTGVSLPYIVTVEENTGKVLSVYRNWREQDAMKRRRIYFVKYGFIPGMGFYDLGLIHLIGGLQAAATGLLREIIDAGALASLQGGFVTKDGNLRGQRLIVEPGVWKQIDATSDELGKSFFSPPFKEPSPVLFQLLGLLTQRGEKFVGTTDLQTGNNDAKAPVGSVVAILEQGAKVYSTIHRGYHNSMSDELRIRFQFAREKIGSVEGGVYPYDVEGHPRQIMAQDFAPGVAIQPVADPNIFSSTQRLALYQAVAQMALQAPQFFKGDMIAKRMLQAMKVPDYEELLASNDVEDYDPVTENSRLMASLPIQAKEQQNHQAHIAVHMQFMQSPGFGGNPQIAQHVTPAMIAHLGQHLGFQYRQGFQQAGVPMPPIDPKTGGYAQSPPDTNQIAAMAAQAAPQLLNQPGLPPQQPQTPQPSPVDQAKAAAIAQQNQQTLQHKQESHQQAIQHHQELNQLHVQGAATRVQAKTMETDAEMRIKAARFAQEAQQAAAANSLDQQLKTRAFIQDATLTNAEKLQQLRNDQLEHANATAQEAISGAHDRIQTAMDAAADRGIAEEKAAQEIKVMAQKAKQPKAKKPKNGDSNG